MSVIHMYNYSNRSDLAGEEIKPCMRGKYMFKLMTARYVATCQSGTLIISATG